MQRTSYMLPAPAGTLHSRLPAGLTPALIPGNHHDPELALERWVNGNLVNPQQRMAMQTPCVTATTRVSFKRKKKATTRGHGTAVQYRAWAQARRLPPSRWALHSSSPHHMGTKTWRTKEREGKKKKKLASASRPSCISAFGGTGMIAFPTGPDRTHLGLGGRGRERARTRSDRAAWERPGG
jgi:hypothetical protein